MLCNQIRIKSFYTYLNSNPFSSIPRFLEFQKESSTVSVTSDASHILQQITIVKRTRLTYSDKGALLVWA